MEVNSVTMPSWLKGGHAYSSVIVGLQKFISTARFAKPRATSSSSMTLALCLISSACVMT